MEITAQFIIDDESIYSGGNRERHGNVKEAIIRRLRNRSATFDKIVEADSRPDDPQLNDFQGPSDEPRTLVDVTMEINESVLQQLEADQDLVFVKAISELEKDSIEIVNEWQRESLAHVDFKKRS
ncbi:MAG TPA: hypothetical protein VGB43_08605 [Flavobacterium sp.]|jgi:hypothetical protein